MKMSLSVKALCHGDTFLRLTSSIAQREVYHSSALVMKEGSFLLGKETFPYGEGDIPTSHSSALPSTCFCEPD